MKHNPHHEASLRGDEKGFVRRPLGSRGEGDVVVQAGAGGDVALLARPSIHTRLLDFRRPNRSEYR